MQGLHKLRCSHNALSGAGVPWTTLGLLPALEQLLLDHNTIAAVGPCICQATALRVLDLSHNALTELPPDLGALARLESLDLSRNQLSALPDSLGAVFDGLGGKGWGEGLVGSEGLEVEVRRIRGWVWRDFIKTRCEECQTTRSFATHPLSARPPTRLTPTLPTLATL